MFRARADGKEVELIGHRFNKIWDFTLKPPALMQFEVATAISHNLRDGLCRSTLL